MVVETSTLTTNIERNALPSNEILRSTPKITMETIQREISTRKQGKDIYTFDLTIFDQDYDVSLYASRAQKTWLLVFNKVRSNTTPLTLKLATGYKIATYYEHFDEFEKIKDFFGFDTQKYGRSSKLLFEKINQQLIFVEQVPFSRRQNLMDQHDQSINPDERDKIYFGGFIHLGLSKNGNQRHRSYFNTWKVQHILPVEVWEQIRRDDTLSVEFVTRANAGYAIEAEEIAKIKAMISTQLQNK